MASRIHDILPRIALWVSPLFALGFGAMIWGAVTYLQLPAETGVLDVVEGEWGWTRGENTCKNNPHTISISDDSLTMTLSDTSGSWTYDILEHEHTRIRGAIRGEKRLTDKGVPVVWDLLMRGPDMYTWHRTDWPGMQTTDLMVRCGKGWNAQ